VTIWSNVGVRRCVAVTACAGDSAADRETMILMVKAQSGARRGGDRRR
jgi:hypothetical protein